MVKMIESMDEFNSMLELSKEKLVVVDFTASWYVVLCSPSTRPMEESFGPTVDRVCEDFLPFPCDFK